MIKFINVALVFLFMQEGNAQVAKQNVPNTLFTEVINKVVIDFRNNYNNIQGVHLSPEGETEIFSSNIVLPGTVNTLIYRFHSKFDSTASWQSIIFQGENYDDAVKAYKNTSRQLNKCRFVLPGNGPVGFTGKLKDPEPDITFSASSFKLNTSDQAYAKFFAEIELVNTGFDSWEVRLNLHNKKEDSEMY